MKLKVFASQFFLLIFTLLFCNPHWITNDDPGMMIIASGQYSGSPDPHIIYSNYILGLILSFFYSINNYINWYSVFHILVLYLSLSYISYYLIKIHKFSIQILIFILIISILIYSNLQFTITASVTAVTSLIIIYNKPSDEKNEIAFIITLIITTAIIRWQILILFVFFLLLSHLLRKIPVHIFVKTTIGIIAAIIIVIANIHIYNLNPGWGSYNKYDSMRGQIHGTAKLVDYQAAWENGFPTTKTDSLSIDKLNKINWSINDSNLFLNWAFIADNKYSLSNLITINNEFKKYKSMTEIYKSLSSNININIELFSILILLFLLLYRESKLKLFYIVLPLLFILFSITYFQRMPIHLFISVCLFAIIMTISVINQLPKIMIVPLLFILITTLYFRIEERKILSEGKNVIAEINTSIPKTAKTAFVAGKGYPFLFMPILHSQYIPVQLIGLGWMNNSPLNKELMLKNHISDYSDVIDREDIILITSRPVVNMIITHIKENYNIVATATTIKIIHSSIPEYDNMIIWKIKSVNRQ